MPVRGIMPIDLTSNFGVARDGGKRTHEGLDIMAPEGRELLACVSGRIESKRWNDLGGNTIWLAGDDGYTYCYAHLSRYAEPLQEGQRVSGGDIIGYVGSTGNAKSPHLHFEIHHSRRSPAIDPYPILRADGVLVMPMPLDQVKKPITRKR